MSRGPTDEVLRAATARMLRMKVDQGYTGASLVAGTDLDPERAQDSLNEAVALGDPFFGQPLDGSALFSLLSRSDVSRHCVASGYHALTSRADNTTRVALASNLASGEELCIVRFRDADGVRRDMTLCGRGRTGGHTHARVDLGIVARLGYGGPRSRHTGAYRAVRHLQDALGFLRCGRGDTLTQAEVIDLQNAHASVDALLALGVPIEQGLYNAQRNVAVIARAAGAESGAARQEGSGASAATLSATRAEANRFRETAMAIRRAQEETTLS
jgi:hypothetical protein